MLHEQAPHAEWDSIARVRRDLALPECLGNDAEHGAAVELLTAGLEGMHMQRADGA